MNRFKNSASCMVLLCFLALQACADEISQKDNDLNRKEVELMLKGEKWPEVTWALTNVSSGGIARPADFEYKILDHLVAQGWLTLEEREWRHGMPRYPSQTNFGSHNYKIWLPTAKMEPFLRKIEQDSIAKYKIEFVVAKGQFKEVTGLTKIDENTYQAEFNFQFVINDLGQDYLKNYGGRFSYGGSNGFRFRTNEVLSHSKRVKRYDDGWRLASN